MEKYKIKIKTLTKLIATTYDEINRLKNVKKEINLSKMWYDEIVELKTVGDPLKDTFRPVIIILLNSLQSYLYFLRHVKIDKVWCSIV